MPETRKNSFDESRIRDIIKDELKTVMKDELKFIINSEITVMKNEFSNRLESMKQDFINQIALLKQDLHTENEKVRNMITTEIKAIHEKVKHHDDELAYLKSFLVSKEQEKLRETRASLSANFVISGLPESSNETPDNLSSSVDSLLGEINARVEAVSINRIGKKSGTKPRLVKVITKSKDDRNKVLHRSKDLRLDQRFKEVFIDPDRCRIDQREHLRLRNVVKTLRNDNPNKRVVLYKGEVLVDDKVYDFEQPLTHIFPEF